MSVAYRLLCFGHKDYVVMVAGVMGMGVREVTWRIVLGRACVAGVLPVSVMCVGCLFSFYYWLVVLLNVI